MSPYHDAIITGILLGVVMYCIPVACGGWSIPAWGVVTGAYLECFKHGLTAYMNERSYTGANNRGWLDGYKMAEQIAEKARGPSELETLYRLYEEWDGEARGRHSLVLMGNNPLIVPDSEVEKGMDKLERIYSFEEAIE